MYSLDFLHPDRLRCDLCGHALPVALDIWDGPAGLRKLTEEDEYRVAHAAAEAVRRLDQSAKKD